MQKPQHILVIRFSALGDVAMTVPVLRALTEQHPELFVTVVTRAFFKPLFKDIPNVAVYPADLQGKHKGVLGLLRLAKALRALKFDAVADLHNVLRTHILKIFFSGKRVVQIDKGRSDKKALTSGQVFKQLKTTHQRYADVFEVLGFRVDLSHPTFRAKAELNSKLKRFISKPEWPVIGIAPFAAHEGKMYPLEKMEQLIEAISERYSIVLFGGGAKEIDILDAMESKFVNVKSAAGKLNLEQQLDLISNIDLMLSMDSGNGHLAAMLGKKVLIIWGVTHPYAGFSPFNQPDDYALLADRERFPKVPTSIYGNKQPEGYENAAGSVSVEFIEEKINSLLSKNYTSS